MCGIAAFVEVAQGAGRPAHPLSEAAADAEAVVRSGIDAVARGGVTDAARRDYAGGDERIARLTEWARGLKRTAAFADLAGDEAVRRDAAALAANLRAFADAEDARLQAMTLAESDLELLSARALRVRDVAWHVEQEAMKSAAETVALCGGEPSPKLLVELRRVVAVLRCIDRIEIRGRDSAGAAVQVAFDTAAAFEDFKRRAGVRGLSAEMTRRSSSADLPAMSVALSEGGPGRRPAATFVYKVAAEVGRLGDNVAELRRQIGGDALLRAALGTPGSRALTLGHTRWASSGVISVPNCHPVDNGAYAGGKTDGPESFRAGRVFVVLNGDVDNHLELRQAYESATGCRVSPRVTTDTKVIALEIERHLTAGLPVDEAFRRASAAFLGSCAIGMITDLAPGKLFLSLRGSGQSLYVGISEDGFFGASEVYGLVEETARYVKLDGERDRVPGDPSTRGEIAIVSDEGPRGAEGVDRRGFDGKRLPVAPKDVRTAEITTRDVDRGDFEHFFRKEITQSSRSVRRTLWGRVLVGEDGRRRLASHVLSEKVRSEIESGHMNRVYLVGQGTAAVAGTGIADYLRALLPATQLRIHALPATEMSGFYLEEDMSRTLVIAVTQSGSSADTNRAVDLARQRGAHVVAVVNRRNSDITYRADGVVYTSDGRDVEMSVASTKAFYSQLVAGALLSLAIARAMGKVDDAKTDALLAELAALPDLMQRVLDDESSIVAAAERLAPTRSQWAVVASGPNRVAAAEARIKLSELCYKSIALDTVENKKHIDLSTEPLILVLAAGNPETVLNDVVKDVAIFKAHKALPVVFASEGEKRFDPYAAAVVHLPKAPPFSSMCLLALASHLFGYHAARAIDENARFLAGIRASLVAALSDDAARRSLPQTLAAPRREYLDRLQRERFTSAMLPVTAVRLAAFLDIATGVGLATPESQALLGADGGDVVAASVNVLGEALDQCTRPVDAIKHQAKIVTVGTSRPQEALTGPVADSLTASGVVQESLLPVDLLEIARVQPAIAAVDGLTRYSVTELRADGTIAPETQIRVVERRGVAAGMRSRVDGGGPLTGTKRQVVAARRLFLGIGGGDNRRIAILPVLGGDRHVAGLVLLHLRFAAALPRDEKLRVLGPKTDRIRDLVAEANRAFDPSMVDALTPEQAALEDADDLARRVLAAVPR
jgi:glucosamine--fructose-6-phosphate aminotransferase (isomerizing)